MFFFCILSHTVAFPWPVVCPHAAKPENQFYWLQEKRNVSETYPCSCGISEHWVLPASYRKHYLNINCIFPWSVKQFNLPILTLLYVSAHENQLNKPLLGQFSVPGMWNAVWYMEKVIHFPLRTAVSSLYQTAVSDCSSPAVLSHAFTPPGWSSQSSLYGRA